MPLPGIELNKSSLSYVSVYQYTAVITNQQQITPLDFRKSLL